MRRASGGFTLLEAVLVLLIGGMLIEAVLYGQTLIQGARVQALIAQQGATSMALLAFQDRYRALPGDYGNSAGALDCEGAACPGGNGDGLIAGAPENEDIMAWTHLSAAKLLIELLRIESPLMLTPTDSNTPRNVYGGFLQVASDEHWGISGNSSQRVNVKLGNFIPVEVLAEVDRRIDDGRPAGGRLQFSAYAPGSEAPPITGTSGCLTADSAGADWNVRSGQANCGAAWLLN